MNEEIHKAELIVQETNSLITTEADRLLLIQALQPIAAKMPAAVEMADKIEVTNAAQAEQAALLIESWTNSAEDAEKIIREFGGGLLEKLFRIHRKGTALIARFQTFKDAAKTVKRKILNWHEAEQEKSRKEQERLQAEADERARKERERLEKEAARLKTPEKKEQRLAQAAQVVSPIIHIASPEKVVSSRKVWKVVKIDFGPFVKAIDANPQLQGFIAPKLTELQRAKAANPRLEIPGIQFKQESV